MVLNAAVQTLREAEELKQKILKFKSGTSMLQERSLWTTQQELQKVYQKVLVLDLDYALDKKVEQDLWNIGFKQQIEALQAISKDRKNPLRSEGQAMLSWVLQAAAGFYLCLLHQICTTFKLDLPFRRRASLLGLVEGWGTSVGGAVPPAAAARYICQHCLIHLGDLARYRQQLRVANTFYRQALAVSAHSGQPYNQLALLCWRRGRRLGALYCHVRAVLVRAPFPPAAANLNHTLRAAVSRENSNVPPPVLLGMKTGNTGNTCALPARLDTHSYVTYLLRALHNVHTLEQLDSTPALVKKLNSSLTALIATESFDPMTLIKMACVKIWLVCSTEGSALTAGEALGAALARQLAAGALLALLLPNYSREHVHQHTLPALKVWLSWALGESSADRVAWLGGRGAVWPALAHTLNLLAADTNDYESDEFSSVPLSEDCELLGFTPLEHAMEGLVFPQHAAWDCYGGKVPAAHNTCELSVGPACGADVLRARRVLRLGMRVADHTPEHLAYTEVEGVLKFTATLSGDEDLSEAIAEAAAEGGVDVTEHAGGDGDGNLDIDDDEGEDRDEDGDENSVRDVQLVPPLVISEADFREKVREKRLGILKPQGSLERAREERALATQEDQDPDSTDEGKSEDKKESRKPRVNIAMAAIMRKQEETNKQVKFVTPPPTPDSTGDANDSDNKDKPKIIQPKAIKSLANLPTGRKTGGILSLKDKSAGYPHLVNAEPEPKKPEKEEKKDAKPSQNLSQNSQNYQQKRQEHVPSPNWSQNQQSFNEGSRMGFQKNYGIQTAGISYNPNYAAGVNSPGIRLPVVNPKEIDVRTAAMQKQNSRQELFQDGNKFGNYNYPITGDKKNFMSDLPPRFANQYRYWNTGQEPTDNKFRDDSFQSNQGFVQQPQRPNWNTPAMPESFQVQLPPWWTPDNQQNFNYTNSAVNVPTNFYNPHVAGNTYQTMPSYQMQNQSIGQQKDLNPAGYLNPAPQLNLQNLTSNFNSPLNKFGSYAPTVGYDSSMYPQFNSTKLNYPPPLGKDKPELGYHGNKELEMPTLGYDLQQRNLNFNEGSHIKSLEQMRSSEGVSVEPPVSTYSLFSAAQDAAWGPAQPQPHQSLWSGPGPSPLERLLEQQKQMKQPPAPQ